MTNEYYFMYSTLQIQHENTTAKKISKTFKCGIVSVSGKKADYSKMIPGDEMSLKNYCKMYPDAKIVAKGTKLDLKYTPTMMA